MEEKQRRLSFTLRMINNQIRAIVCRSVQKSDRTPQSQLQGGIMGFLYHHREAPVYQKDIEKEFRISRATATNTLQVMEKNGLIVRKSEERDARLKRISMTPEAAANHMKVEADMQRLDDRMLRGLTDEEVAELDRLLQRVMKNLEAAETESSADGICPQEKGAVKERPQEERKEVQLC